MTEIKRKLNQWNEVIYESVQIMCSVCGRVDYLSGISVKWHVEHHLSIPTLCSDCNVKRFVEAHHKKY
jgi:hypothetical protein